MSAARALLLLIFSIVTMTVSATITGEIISCPG